MSSCVVVLDRCPLPDDTYDEDEMNASDVNRNACASQEIVSGDSPITLPSDPPLEILRCDKCQYHTKIASLYRNHVAKHSPDLNFKCPSCDFSEAGNIEFVEHFATHQTGNVLQCYFCAKQFSKAQMKPHMLIHRATELYDCSMCEFSTNYARTIKYHTEAFHVREFKCNECDQRMTKYELLLHSKSAHSSNDSLLTKSPVLPKFAKSSGAPVEISDNDSKKLPSDTSSMTRLRTPKDIDANNHESYLAKPCNVTPAKKAQGIQESNRIEFTSDVDNSQVSNNDSIHIQQYKCDTCDQVMTKHDLQLHRTFHSSPASTSNSESAESQIHCLKTPAMNDASLSESCQDAPTKVELDSHEPLPDGHNSGGVSLKQYDCPDCRFSTMYHNSLQRHHQSFHINQHQCNECDQVMTKHDLLLHKTTHNLPASTLNSESLESRGSGAVVATLVEPDQIDLRSPRAMLLTADNPPRTYKRRSRKFNTMSSKLLKRHVVKHLVDNSFVCPKCGFTTLDNSTFVAHLPSHSEGITIKCCYCRYEAPKTRMEWLMSRHIESHRRSLLFDCSKCEFSCSRADNLQHHFMRRHSKLGGKKRVKSKHVWHSGRGANQSVANPKIGIPEHLKEHDEELSEELIPLAPSMKECHVVLERVEFHESRLSVGDQSDPTESQSAAQDPNLPCDGSKRTFECSKCFFRTKKKYLLKKHVAKHLQDFRLTCPNCGLKEMSSYNFSRHIEEHQQQGNVFKCCFCDCRPFISRNTLAGHLNKHRSVTLVDCPKCKFSSHRTDLLNDHMNASHVKRYQCYVCGEVMSRFRLRYHMPNAHKQQLKVCRPIRMVSSENTDKEPSENDCRKTFKSYQQMDAQSTATLADPELTDDCSYSVGQISGKRLGDTDKEDRPTISDVQLVDYESMDLEPLVNQTKRGLATPQSGQSISNISRGNPQSLKSSAKCTKLAKPFLRCSNCNFKTRIKSLLKRHVVKHLIDSRFACTKCHFKESCSFKFACHWLCHDTGPDSKKVRCCFCPIQYNRLSCYKGTLAVHLDKHRTVDLFDCSKCKFSCSNRFKFDCHSKTHTIKQACVTCGKFMTLYRLSNHGDSCQSSEQTVVPSSHSTAGSENMEIEEDLPSSTMSCKSVLTVDSSSNFMLYAGSSIQKCPEMSVEESHMTEDIDEQVLCMMCKNWLSLFDYMNHECSQFNAAMNAVDRGSPIVPASDTSESLFPGLDGFPEGLELLNSDDWNIFDNSRTIEISPTDSAWLSGASSAPGFSGGQQDGE